MCVSNLILCSSRTGIHRTPFPRASLPIIDQHDASVAHMPTLPALLTMLKHSNDPDAMVLAQMAENGADLNKPHEPDFAFVMTEPETAHAVADELDTLGFHVDIYTPDEDNSDYQVVGKRVMVLDLRVINQLTVQFEALANKHNAIYDGWGAEIVE